MARAEELLARARGAVGKRTIYALDAPPPAPHLETWPEHTLGDCSGFVGWCCGLTRRPDVLGGDDLSTNTIYADAAGEHLLFEAVGEPQVGGIVVYPHYRFEMGGQEHAGHVAIITRIRSADDYMIIDCALSSWTDTGDAIREHEQTAFSAHARAALAARTKFPDLPSRLTRPPIFARALERH